MTNELVITAPNADAPGFLRRRQELITLERDLYLSLDAASVDKFVAFFLPYVTKPKDEGAARDALMDLARRQMGDLILSFTRSDGEDFVPFAKAGT